MSNPTSIGKSIPLEDFHEGRSYREFTGEKVKPQTTVSQDENGMVLIASKISAIAAEVSNYDLKRKFRKKEDGSIAFFYSIQGNFENLTVDEIAILAELLRSTFGNDYSTQFMEFFPVMDRVLSVKVNFKNQIIYLYATVKFEKEWTPSEEKWEEVK